MDWILFLKISFAVLSGISATGSVICTQKDLERKVNRKLDRSSDQDKKEND